MQLFFIVRIVSVRFGIDWGDDSLLLRLLGFLFLRIIPLFSLAHPRVLAGAKSLSDRRSQSLSIFIIHRCCS
jgi:hypothetical protein